MEIKERGQQKMDIIAITQLLLHLREKWEALINNIFNQLMLQGYKEKIYSLCALFINALCYQSKVWINHMCLYSPLNYTHFPLPVKVIPET